MSSSDLIEARRVLQVEAESLLLLRDSLDERFSQAVNLIYHCKGKLLITGMGKSGLVGRKMASTFSSTGTPSVFLHPAESLHGDIGLITADDLILAISYGGHSPELEIVLKVAQRRGCPIIAMTGKLESFLSSQSNVLLEVKITEEACPLRLAPTSSSTATLALGDALAMAVLKRRGFRKEDFAENHPAGLLGRRLTTRVSDLMQTGDSLPLVKEMTPLNEVIGVMTSREVRGVAGVVNSAGMLVGIITDGDLRRSLQKENFSMQEQAYQLMTVAPKTIDKDELAEKALFIMEEFKISILFVCDKRAAAPNQPIGLIHIQDLLAAKIR